MRRATAGLLLTIGGAIGAASCAPVLRQRLSPDLAEYRLAILVRPVAGRCRTTTIPALAVATSRQRVIWEVMSFDPAACKAADVTVAAKSTAAASSEKGRGFAPTPGERGDTWTVRNLPPGRYKYDVRIGSETEDPELEIWR